ncbi:MAG: HPF/RaiA family ribosome-associated protein [bacterium]|nr:HPF/RaiA family ribosome-associated protein [bacterium]
MRTTIKATNIEHTNAIDAYLAKRLRELERILEPKEQSELARIEIGKLTKHHHSGRLFFAEITFHVKNKDFRATGEGADLYEAIDKMQAMIVREVKRRHELVRVKRKSGAREIKQRITGA